MTSLKPLSARICRWLAVVFAAAYALALVIYLIGEFGLFGQARGPLVGAFLIPLGLPWNLAIDELPAATWP